MQQPFKLTLIAAMLAAAAPALADQTAEQVDSAELETIQVTARNRSTRTEHKNSYTTSAMRTTTGLALSPKETPQSVSVITKRQISDQGITRMEDALRTTTGINVIPDSGRWRFQSRGFYIDQIEEDGLASTVAGSAMNPYNDSQSMSSLAIYDHIEVVRGATGLTQSNSEPGGTINAVRKRPTSQRQVQGEVLFDRFGKIQTSIDVSGSLNQAQSVRGRLVGVLGNDQSFKETSKDNTQLIYGIIDADVGENDKITFGGLFQHQSLTPDPTGLPMGNGYDLNLSYNTYLGAPWNKRVDHKANLFAEWEHRFNDSWKYVGKINYLNTRSSNEFAFITNTGGRFAGVDSTGLVSGATENIQLYRNRGHQFTFHNALTGKFNALGREHDVFATYQYSKEVNRSYNPWKVRSTHPYNIHTFDWGSIAKPDWSSGNDGYTDSGRVITTHALGAGIRFNPLESLHVLAALRFTHWQYDSPNYKTGVTNTWQRNTLAPYFGISYDIAPNHSLYASYTTIQKPQTLRDMSNNILDPIKNVNYEAGWKADWRGDGKLNTSLALFQVTQENRPYDLNVRNAQGNWAYSSIGKIRSRGFEAEVSGSLTENWELFAGYTYNNSKYLVSEGGRYTPGTNFSKHTPRHMFRLHTSYRLPVNDGKWSVNGGISVQSKTDSLWSVKQGGYALVHAGVQYRPNEHLQFSLIGSNLTDRRYYENHRIRTQGINNLYGEPRNIMLKLDWKL